MCANFLSHAQTSSECSSQHSNFPRKPSSTASSAGSVRSGSNLSSVSNSGDSNYEVVVNANLQVLSQILDQVRLKTKLSFIIRVESCYVVGA